MRRSHRAPAVVTASRCSLTPLPNERLSLDHVLCYRAAASRIHRQQNVSSVPPPAASSLLCHPRTTCFATMHPRTTCPATMSHTYRATCPATMSHTYHVPRYYVTHVPRVSLLCHPCATCLATMSPMCHVSRYFVPPPTASSGLPPRLSRDNACVGHTWSLPRLHVQRIGHHCKHRAG